METGKWKPVPKPLQHPMAVQGGIEPLSHPEQPRCAAAPGAPSSRNDEARSAGPHATSHQPAVAQPACAKEGPTRATATTPSAATSARQISDGTHRSKGLHAATATASATQAERHRPPPLEPSIATLSLLCISVCLNSDGIGICWVRRRKPPCWQRLTEAPPSTAGTILRPGCPGSGKLACSRG